MYFLDGKEFGRYRVVELLGKGGMGEVYKAVDTHLNRQVALKVLRDEYTKDETCVKRFEQEALAASGLNHPHIFTVYDIGSIEGRHFIATEFIDGETLRKKIRSGGMNLGHVFDLSIQIVDALHAAHEAAILHRDIKPENIMVRPDGYVKVLDFGLAKLVSVNSGSTLETLPGLILGTPQYMSPEQSRGLTVDIRTDVWSFGVVLYEMLTGVNHFFGLSIGEVFASILEHSPLSLCGYRQDVPPALEALVSRALAKNIDERHNNMAELKVVLKEVRRSYDAASYDVRPLDTIKIAEETPPGNTNKAPIPKRHSRKAIRSLAVLPFKNESSDTRAEYLSDGITETIINNLSQIPHLRIMSRSSAFRFKAVDLDPTVIGNELKVSAVLTGRLLKVGSRLVLQTELIRVEDGTQIWGYNFNQKMSDIFKVQEQIAQEISEKLQLRLSTLQKKRLSKLHTIDERAYLSYLKGRFHWNKRSADAQKTSLSYFREALEADPLYALAYAGIADCYAVLGNQHLMPAIEAYSKAKAAASKALELDPSLAEANTTLGYVLATLDRDWTGSEKAFRKAIENSPGYATAHQWFSVILRALGRFEDALSEALTAYDLDPLSPIINATVGQCLYFARQYDEAIKRYKQMSTLDDDFSWTHYLLGCAYRQIGEYELAIGQLVQALHLLDSEPVVVSDLANAYGVSGNIVDADRLIEQLNQMAKQQHVSPYDLAVAHVGVGDELGALSHLEDAYQKRDDGLLMIGIDPVFDALREDERFKDLMRRVGL